MTCEHLRTIAEEDAMLYPSEVDMGAIYKEEEVIEEFDLNPGSDDAVIGGCSCDQDKNNERQLFCQPWMVNINCPLHGRKARHKIYE